MTNKEFIMSISARNVFKGKVTAIKDGPVNGEVEITTAGGDKVVAMLTESSARNQLRGVVSALVKGAVSCYVKVTLPGGAVVSAMVTNESAIEMGLVDGVCVIALFKASHVLVGVPA